MARSRVQAFIRDEAGNKLGGTGYEVRFYQVGTNTLQTLYPDAVSATTIPNPHYPNAGAQYALSAAPLTTDTVIGLASVAGLQLGDFVTFDDGTVRTERCITAINSGASQITIHTAIGRAYATGSTRVNGRENLGHVAAYCDTSVNIEATVKNLATGIEGPRELIIITPPTADLVKLDEILVGTTAGYLAATNQFDFPTAGGSLAQTYRELILVIQGRNDGAVTSQTVTARLGTGGGAVDAGANYDWENNQQNAAATSAPTNGVAQTSWFVGNVAGANAPAGACGSIVIEIPNYSGAVFRKQFVSEWALKTADTNVGMFVGATSGEWRNTGAITGIRVLTGAGNLIVGSVLSLYGRK